MKKLLMVLAFVLLFCSTAFAQTYVDGSVATGSSTATINGVTVGTGIVTQSTPGMVTRNYSYTSPTGGTVTGSVTVRVWSSPSGNASYSSSSGYSTARSR